MQAKVRARAHLLLLPYSSVDIPVGGARHEIEPEIVVDNPDVDVNMKADICNMNADRITILIVAV